MHHGRKTARSLYTKVRTVSTRQIFTAGLCSERFGEFPASYDDEHFTELRVELSDSERWLRLASIRVQENDAGDAPLQRSVVSYENYRQSYQVAGGTLVIESFTGGGYFLYSNYPSTEITFKQSTYLSFAPSSVVARRELQFIFSKIEELLALVFGSYHHLPWPVFVRQEDDSFSWDTIYFPRDAAPSEEVNEWFCWVSFDKVKDVLGTLFESWQLASEGIGAGCYLYVASLRNPQVYVEDRFVSLAIGLEALHRRWIAPPKSSPEMETIRARVRRILDSFPARR